jgi:hypothetical protein
MATFIASYDLKETQPDPHPTFLKEAEKRGWSRWFERVRLPNTTLVGTFTTAAEAVAALDETRAATEKNIRSTVTMEKWIIAQYGGAPSFDSNETQ